MRFLLLVLPLTILPARPTSAQPCDSLTIDIRRAVVAGVPIDVTIDSLASILAPERIGRTIEHLETEPSPLYRIDFCGHVVERHWNGLSWNDPAFVTAEGLRIGQPLTAFDSTYGAGEVMWSEAGVVVAYPLGEWQFLAGIGHDCVAETDEMPPRTKSRDCPVGMLWIPLQTLPE